MVTYKDAHVCKLLQCSYSIVTSRLAIADTYTFLVVPMRVLFHQVFTRAQKNTLILLDIFNCSVHAYFENVLDKLISELSLLFCTKPHICTYIFKIDCRESVEDIFKNCLTRAVKFIRHLFL